MASSSSKGGTITPQKCGVRVDPPTLVLTYTVGPSDRQRQRSMPLRNFGRRSGVERAVRELKSSPRHRRYLEAVSSVQLERLLGLVKERLSGVSLEDSLAKAKSEAETARAEAKSAAELDPDEDLNKLNDDALDKRKSLMDRTFERNRKKPGEEGYHYDVEVDFAGAVESSGWDSAEESDPSF